MHYDMNRQAQIDRQMCKPGYTWNETLQRCLGAGGGEVASDPASPQKPTPDGAIAMEKASRESTGEVL
jgi:hypothetical protein